MTALSSRFEVAAKFFHIKSWFRLLALCVLVGIIAGLGAFAFDRGLRIVDELILSGHSGMFAGADSSSGKWLLMVVPAIGGALAGALALWLAPEATGHGTDSVIRAFHRKKGEIRARVPLVKGVCSILTIGTGGSAGKEGPIAQIGAGFGSTIAPLLNLTIRDRRILMLAGVAGGIGAIFKAPLGGALFAAEMLYREPDFEHDAIIPGVISSVTAYSVFTSMDGYTKILQFKNAAGQDLPPLAFPSSNGNGVSELLHYALLSLLCALVAFLFVKGLKWFEHGVFERLPLSRITKPALGGLLLGALAILLMVSVAPFQKSMPPGPDHPAAILGASRPEHIMGGGYGYLQTVVNSALDPRSIDYWSSLKLAGFLGVVVLAKILATALTLGSGGSGGTLFPALFLGGVTGAAYAKLWRALADAHWVPRVLALSPDARASMILVGMGGVFAACTKTPIASLVMVSEITGSYGLVVPLMMTCASAYLLSHSFTINEEQVPGIGDSPAHRGDFLVNVLEDMTVADALLDRAEPETFAAGTPFSEVLERIKGSHASVFPIVDERNCLVGIFSLSDIRQIMNEKAMGNLIVAGDLGTRDVTTVTLATNLDEALRIFTQRNIDEIPVVESASAGKPASRTAISAAVKMPRGPAGTMKVVGMLSRHGLIAAYHRRLRAIQTADAQEQAGSALFVEVQDDASRMKTQKAAEPDEPEALKSSGDASQPTEELLSDFPEEQPRKPL